MLAPREVTSVPDRKKIILDVDTGIDDAWALYYALTSPKLEILGITTVFGNADLETTTRNTLIITELLGSDVPVYPGAERPLIRPWTGPVPAFHGVNGLGDTPLPAPNRRPESTDASDYLRAMIRRHAGDLTLVTVARLTNLARCFIAEPSLAASLAEVVVMGGAAFVPGNVTATAEANIWGDPEAAQVVFQSGVPITLVGLDVTLQARLRTDDLESWRDSGPLARILKEATRFYIAAYQKDDPENDGWCPLHDPLAVAVAEDHSLVETSRYPVMIETRGQWTDGMTVVDGRQKGAGARVALGLDSTRFVDTFKSRLLR